MAFVYTATSSIGGDVKTIKVNATTSVLTGGDAAATLALNAIYDVVYRMTAEPFLVSAPYAAASNTAVIFVVPNGIYDAAAMQTAVRASGLTGLTSATVTVTSGLTA